MPAKKKPSPAQLAARAKFVAMVRAKSKAKKSATKKISGTKKKATKLPSLFDKPTSRQTGTSNKVKDATRKALAPGKRKSATGKSYTERRANRSDKPGSLLGVNITNLSIKKIKENNQNIEKLESALIRNKEKMKLSPYKTQFWKTWFKVRNTRISAMVKELKVENTKLKKHIK